MKRLDPQLEELARLIGEIVAGRGISPGEATAFRAGLPQSRTNAFQIADTPVNVAGVDDARQQCVVHHTGELTTGAATALDIAVVDGPDGTFERGLPIGPALERGLGDYTGEVWIVADPAIAAGTFIDVRVRLES